MTRKVALVGGGALVVAGFVLALVALAVPWAHFRLAVDVSGLAMVDVRATRGPGVGYGIAAPLVLALGGALLSVRTQQN